MSQPNGATSVRRLPLWPFAVLALLVALGLAAVWAWNVLLPYYALSPGPIQQVEPLIEIQAAGVDLDPPGGGDLYFLTVELHEINLYEYLEARFDPRVDLVARELIRPEGVTPEELRESSLDMMEESKNLAVCVALRHLGYQPVCEGQGAQVVGLVGGAPAAGVLEEGDVIVAIEGEPVAFAADAAAAVSRLDIGQTITLTVLREDRRLDLEVELVEHVEEPGRPMVGVLLQSLGLRFEFPFDVEIDSQNIGGPSAGLMYTLGIIDRLSQGDLTKGHLIAGTGTIELDGRVGAIGGARQKVFAARAAGAQYVLIPVDNGEEARAAAGEAIEVIEVERLGDALRFLESLNPAS